MKIRRKISINLEKLYSPPEIKRLYRENKISLVGYEDAVRFIKENLKTVFDDVFGYEWIYHDKKLCFMNNEIKVYSDQILFYIKDSHNNVALLSITKHNNGCIKYTQLSTSFLENYKFITLI